MIVVCCGPPGAGKTTLTTAVRDRLEGEGVDVRSYHSDDFSRGTYERLYARAAVASPSTEPAERPVVTLVDGTFYRREWQRVFRTLESVRFVRVTAALETCLERNRRREDAIDERGVHVVYREFEPPAADLVIDTDETSPAAAAEQVTAAVGEWLESDRDADADRASRP
ncbi:AAA family ATPase [Halopiger goleimassiliensis]|uniref:AAA family ATPase n=1 Tax=Halopiger goleimassiliensis TaxID=1293048 RepID=UPI000677A51F|nr:AAA family ATPase [Halopiger goleimassiliensis]